MVRGSMKIVFLGEETLSRRTQAVRRQLERSGHDVVALTTDTTASLNPEKTGGWVWLGLSILAMARQRPDVVHLQGPKAVYLTWLAGMLHPEATYIWTIDSLLPRWIARQAAKAVDAITTPSRSFQVRLLAETGVRAQYVPDGYEAASEPVRKHGRKKAYCVTTARAARDVRWITSALKEAGSKYRLISLKDVPEDKRMSILESAQIVILHNNKDTAEDVLKVMDAGRAVIATTKPLYEETLGVTAMYVAPKDVTSLAAAAHLLLKSPARRRAWGRKARQRAQQHFTWERVTGDYLRLYRHSKARLVPLDSARRPLFTQLPV